ncbi:hypothetical protein B0H15DRAFT_466716 [Mycena belliarum]|uniref:UBA domain-containing protein n=1 Tax=Mycena belliarum TaxID=1033014 RepID=A0AAD6TVZ8_9AGAR|nr:hypothetical protein B0H15DRAFT_466716 [Mycena belliae]
MTRISSLPTQSRRTTSVPRPCLTPTFPLSIVRSRRSKTEVLTCFKSSVRLQTHVLADTCASRNPSNHVEGRAASDSDALTVEAAARYAVVVRGGVETTVVPVYYLSTCISNNLYEKYRMKQCETAVRIRVTVSLINRVLSSPSFRMSDSFADLWNTTAPSKPAPQKLGTPSPALPRRPTNDVFALLSSASSPSSSRPITPATRPAPPQRPRQPSSNSGSGSGGDAFSGLLGGTLGNGNGVANMTIAERARRVEAERLRKAGLSPPAAAAGSAWDGLDTLAAGSASPRSTSEPAGPGILDDWGFDAPAAPAAKAAPQPQPAALVDDDDWGLGLGATPAPPKPTSPAPTAQLWDALDDFVEAPSPPVRIASPTADFDFGNREDNAGGADDFDILGDLAKPVSNISSRRSTPQLPSRDAPSPAPAPTTRRTPAQQQRPASPPPHILGQLVEMGFSIPQARTALAGTLRDGAWDVQAAIDGLLAGAGGGDARASPRPEREEPPAPRRRPSERAAPQAERERDRERASPAPPSDLLARTTELGFSLFKGAERAWMQGKERVQKVYEERLGGEEGRPERERGGGGGATRGRGRGERGGARGERARPKWMAQDPDEQGEGPSKKRGDEREERGLWRDEEGGAAQGKDDGWGDAGGWKDDEDEEAQPAPAPRKPSPAAAEVNLFDAGAPAKKPYVSPWRHGKKAAAPAAQPPQAARTSPPASRPTAPAGPPPRAVPPVPPAALQTSRTHAAAAQEKIALGQYGAALALYTAALDALPADHPLRAPLLSARAGARLKEGDVRGVEDDAAALEAICTAGGRAPGAEVVQADGARVDLGQAVLDAWKARAEAREGRERWEEAGRDWERVAGAAWARTQDRDEGVRGAGRCRRMAAPPPAPVAKAAAPTRPTRPKVALPPSEALTNLRQANNAQEAEDIARHGLKDTVDGKLVAWKGGKETNIRALLASLDTVLWPELGLAPSGMKDLVTPGQVKVRYVKAIAKLHPDKLNTNNSTLEQRMIANGVFGALNEAWNAFK